MAANYITLDWSMSSDYVVKYSALLLVHYCITLYILYSRTQLTSLLLRCFFIIMFEPWWLLSQCPGDHVVLGKWDVWGRRVVPQLYNGISHRVADGEMLSIRLRQFDKISVQQTYLWKTLFVGFLKKYSVSRSKLRFARTLQNVTIALRKFTHRCMVCGDVYI